MLPLRDDDAFELFTFEQVLKDHDLSLDELEKGQVGGGDDGGIDGLFCFLNGDLLEEDSEELGDTFDPAEVRRNSDLALYVIQSKRSPTFGETPFDKAAAALAQLLDLSKTDEDLAELFSPKLIERIQIFRAAWQKLATRHPVVAVRFIYATKGDRGTINPKVFVKGEQLVQQVDSQIHKGKCDVSYLGARELLDLADKEQSYTLSLTYQENATAGSSYVVLVRLDDYFEFIVDESRQLRKYIFDWNVRDFEGSVEVNQEIRESLSDPDAPQFWWLNNGVTIVCSEASSTGKTFSLDGVQIVNGLQTSVTIYNYLKDAAEDDAARERALLVRIINTDDRSTRDRVIRATNRQTSVAAASLRATDPVQRDIEQFFLTNDWFYDRRKNFYRNQGKTKGRIISIPYLAQAVMAIGFSEPNNSRARPSSLLKRDADYNRVFDGDLDLRLYLWFAQVQKQVDEFLRSGAAPPATSAERSNFRFLVSMLVVARLFGSRVFSPKQLGEKAGYAFSSEELGAALTTLRAAYESFLRDKGGTIDQISKSGELKEMLLKAEFPPSE